LQEEIPLSEAYIFQYPSLNPENYKKVDPVIFRNNDGLPPVIPEESFNLKNA